MVYLNIDRYLDMTITNLYVRRATHEDVQTIADLGARTFKDSFASDNRPEDIEQYLAENFGVAQIDEELKDPLMIHLLAEEEGVPVGYAVLREGESPESVSGQESVELVRIYVDQGLIGKGYGSATMNACLKAAKDRGFQTIWLGVWEINKRAILFYEKWGYQKVGIKEFVLGSDIQTDDIMERSLGDV